MRSSPLVRRCQYEAPPSTDASANGATDPDAKVSARKPGKHVEAIVSCAEPLRPGRSTAIGASRRARPGGVTTAYATGPATVADRNDPCTTGHPGVGGEPPGGPPAAGGAVPLVGARVGPARHPGAPPGPP